MIKYKEYLDELRTKSSCLLKSLLADDFTICGLNANCKLDTKLVNKAVTC